MTRGGYRYDSEIVATLQASYPAVTQLLEGMATAPDRRAATALLAGLDLTRIPRRCFGGFQRHVTSILNNLAD